MELQNISSKIHEIRNRRVMLDFDLAELYGVQNRVLKQAVKRNIDRFPPDFMFVLTHREMDDLVSQTVIPSKGYFGGAMPFAFTEQGVAMLSSILRSPNAIRVNITIMRAFVLIRQYALSHKDLTEKLRELEDRYDRQFSDVYEAIHFLLKKDQQETQQRQRKRIGYKRDES